MATIGSSCVIVVGWLVDYQYEELAMALLRHISFAASMVATLSTIPAQATVIDHNAVNAVSGYSQGTMDQIGHLNYFFSHASVGSNMVEGLNALHTINSGFYQFQTTAASSSPPASALDGLVYELGRGNPGWQEKLNLFEGYLGNGWAGRVDLAMDKFCYVDEDAVAGGYDGYLSRMQGLEQKFVNSGTRLVYATIPLTTGSDGDNILRNNFNNAVRSFVAGSSNRLLFDIADIEAWDANGVQHTFTVNNITYQQLSGGFSADGGHLNVLGSQRVALGFYAVANAALVPEPESYAMLLAGLGLMCTIAGRRRRTAA